MQNRISAYKIKFIKKNTKIKGKTHKNICQIILIFTKNDNVTCNNPIKQIIKNR